MIQELGSFVLNNFDFGFVISVNIITYAIIKIIESITKKEVKKVYKILVTIFVTICFDFIFIKYIEIDKQILLNSSILSPVAWDWVIKPICKLIKIDYKNLDND
jgi:hypothetical protein